MTELSQAKLSVVGLKAYYFANKGVVKAVDNITFAIGENESLGIAGESACGKSTLGSALLRALQPPGKIIGGNVIISGIDIVKLSDKDFNKSIRWKKIAMIFQGAMNTLDPVYKIGDQMREIMQIHQFKGNIEDSILESLEQVGLNRDVAKRYPHELSGGMKQRVVIAMALLLKPDIVIADEPTTALDVLVQAQIVNVLKRLKKENGMTIILITHDLGIISEIADKIAVMYAGQIVEIGKASDIYENPKHPYTQALISAIPTLHDSNKQIEYIKGNPPDLTRPPPGCRFYERCPHAMGICKEDPPEIATETGFTRCWLYVKS
ncbi:MAG: ABC transporter ATP-binding protein [Thermoproteota archaeon]|jgi:peptide/nickel transport system ATP-binding protein|nr:ABC transporter ATP-binding protein [Thermoproteota archaeon]